MTLYDMPLWRPPSEGQNLILQVTLGCSFNACAFCSMYKSKTYRVKPLKAVFADIEDAARDWPPDSSGMLRVFLADGDALALNTDHLLAVLEKLRTTFPALTRVSSYATPINLNQKSPQELARLKAAGLTLIYVGIESGSDEILKRVRKGSVNAMKNALNRADEAGFKISATVILGLGGKTLWREHIEQTAALINRQPTKFLSTLQLGLDPDVAPGFRDAFAKRGGEFEDQDDAGILDELELLLHLLDPPRAVIFRTNHASNGLALAGTLPKDGARLASQVQAAKADFTALRPRHRRGF